MPRISASHLKKMRNSYRHEIARFLAKKATSGFVVTYGELTQQFGGTDRGWGDTLGGIALRCREAEVPLLSVIVVSKATGMPSVDAVLYEDLGLSDPNAIRSEQQRCFDYDWVASPLG